jgi:hypothetical protein
MNKKYLSQQVSFPVLGEMIGSNGQPISLTLNDSFQREEKISETNNHKNHLCLVIVYKRNLYGHL